MKIKKIVSIIGARPQFIKHAAVQLQLQKYFNEVTIHTGQHFDENMSDVFFNDLKIKKAEYQISLNALSSQEDKMAELILALEAILQQELPDGIVVYGDTYSTLAGALLAQKLKIKLIHIEAGLRSFNLDMPEERNRIATDNIANYLFCPTKTAVENLLNEGIDSQKIFMVGDVMIDTINLISNQTKPIYNFKYYFVTLHRPYNVDEFDRLSKILNTLNALNFRIIFSLHPRTKEVLRKNNLDLNSLENIKFIDPVGYFDSVCLQKYSECVITDSGGMQKEAYFLQKKCITIRSETEWVETLQNNWNMIVFEDLFELKKAIEITPGNYIQNLFGDGNASKLIAEITYTNLN